MELFLVYNAPWHLAFMAVMYIIIGVMHFLKPKAFMSVMPRYIPKARLMVYLSGIAEIVLGISLFFSALRSYALWCIIIMLTLFLVVHWHMLRDKKYHVKFPKPLLWIRFFMQFGLMYWAYFYL